MEQIIDDFRFITGLHTTARMLSVCSAIVKTVGQKQLPLNIIKDLSLEWSRKLESSDESYRIRKGKLTELKLTSLNKATTAFEHYVQLLISLGLLHKTGNIVTTTRLAYVLNKITDDSQSLSTLTSAQKIFYFIHLFNKDADALILTMSLLYQQEPLSQKNVLSSFKDAMLNRVSIKGQFSNSYTAQISIRDWYLRITTQWENAEKYAEHLLVPRLEWLRELGIVDARKNGSNSTYALTPGGTNFYEAIPIISDTTVRDIDELWLKKSLLQQFIYIDRNHAGSINKRLIDIDEKQKKEIIQATLLEAFMAIDTSGAMRISLYSSYIYMNIKAIQEYGVYFEFSDLTEYLKEPIVIDNKRYFAKEASRTTESYITITI